MQRRFTNLNAGGVGGVGNGNGGNVDQSGVGGGIILSPKSAENLGLKLVNYILEDSSPSFKELENRVKNIKLYVREN
jgi:hypothetical protein